jgi:hypothetical protein
MNQGLGDPYEIPVPFFPDHASAGQRSLRRRQRARGCPGRPRSLGRGGGRLRPRDDRGRLRGQPAPAHGRVVGGVRGVIVLCLYFLKLIINCGGGLCVLIQVPPAH